MITKMKEQLLKIQKAMENEYLTFKEKQDLYLQYIKLSMYLDSKPVYKNGDRDGNCYSYALDLPFPSFFREVTSSVEFNLGFAYHNFSNPCGDNAKKMLKDFFLDCKALKIKAYNSDLDKKLIHDGYKIALYLKKTIRKGSVLDFHFLRQDSDLSWSEQLGYSGIVQKSETPKHIRKGYELVRVLEIVKPTLR